MTDIIDGYNYDGLTPLMLCCCEEKIEMATILLHANADPNKQNTKSGRTSLFYAAEANNCELNLIFLIAWSNRSLLVFIDVTVELVSLLLEYKADKKVKSFSGLSTHDAMFELDSIDERIKKMVWGKEVCQNKTQTDKRKKKRDSKYTKENSMHNSKKLKIVSKLCKID